MGSICMLACLIYSEDTRLLHEAALMLTERRYIPILGQGKADTAQAYVYGKGVQKRSCMNRLRTQCQNQTNDWGDAWKNEKKICMRKRKREE